MGSAVKRLKAEESIMQQEQQPMMSVLKVEGGLESLAGQQIMTSSGCVLLTIDAAGTISAVLKAPDGSESAVQGIEGLSQHGLEGLLQQHGADGMAHGVLQGDVQYVQAGADMIPVTDASQIQGDQIYQYVTY